MPLSPGKRLGPGRILGLSRRAFLATTAAYAHAAIVQTDFSKLPAYGNGTLPYGIRSRHIAGVNGMSVHILESGYETPNRPAVLLLHGFPELAYSWRKVMRPLAAAGYHVIAPDQRGYGRTTGWDDSYDADPDPFRILNMTRDAMSLVYALGYRSVAMIAGHDAGAPVAAWSALIRPDIFRSITIMSSPFEGPPALPFNTANGAALPRAAITDDELDAELAKLHPPRKYYQNYQRTRGAGDDMLHAPQGLPAFFRAYYYAKSADFPGNKPHPLKARTAAEMAQIPHYYVMEKDQGMASTAASFMPTADYIANCKWLTEAEVEVYAAEYARTGFTGALQGYRVRRGSDPKGIAEMRTFANRAIDVPSQFIAGKSDWGVYQTPGAVDRMRGSACTRMLGFHLVEGAGHWVQQEQSEQVTDLLLRFLRDYSGS
ncbi:MAG TPA: alpha/beta hydrolase [Bryobacteraceae bacterium]|nr:alpha/beta hydrolase [Bryobacteraceae bacterium]